MNLLMWETGKTFDDSSKDFARTSQYIHKTVESLKEVDRTNSRFNLDGGVIVQVRRAPPRVCISMGPFNYLTRSEIEAVLGAADKRTWAADAITRSF